MLSMPSLPRSFVWLWVVACGVQPAPAQEPAAPESTVVEGRVVELEWGPQGTPPWGPTFSSHLPRRASWHRSECPARNGPLRVQRIVTE